MKLTLAREEVSHSLERRWLLENAGPVASRLPPYTAFTPNDVRIWWQADDGQPAEEHTLHAHAWPAERELTVFGEWRSEKAMPEWARDLSQVVHSDLLSNTPSPNTGVADRWAHGLTRRWSIEGAQALKPDRYNKDSFVPVELRIWWSLNVGLDSSENRYSIYAYSAGLNGRRSPENTAQWGSSLASFAYGFDELSTWIHELAEAQYADLEATAAEFTAERESRE